jgi:hypothetical protein
VLFYGSCLRTGNTANEVIDLYVVVDDYQRAYRTAFQACLNRILPPNVYYLELLYDRESVRAKYAVFSLKHLRAGTSVRWFNSYLWGRLTQPAAIVYARDDPAAETVCTSMASAAVTFVARVLPCMPREFGSRQFWAAGFALTYGTELRAERRERPVLLYDYSPQYYDRILQSVLEGMPFVRPDRGHAHRHDQYSMAELPSRGRGRFSWGVRRIQGKMLSILRLLKGLLTFKGGPAYVQWKIQRHAGFSADIAPGLARIPLLGAGLILWRLYRRGGFR